MRSAKIYQSFKGPGKRIELWVLVPVLLSSAFHLILFIAWLALQPQAFSPWCSLPSAIRLRGLMMNMKMALNTVIPLQLCSLWHTTADGGVWEYETPEPKSTLRQRGRKKKHSKSSKLVRWHNCQFPASCDSCPPITGAAMLSMHDKREMGACFFIGDLSVSWLSSHNKSPALSWAWTFGASGGRRMTCRPLKYSGSSDGSAALTEKYTQQSNQ